MREGGSPAVTNSGQWRACDVLFVVLVRQCVHTNVFVWCLAGFGLIAMYAMALSERAGHTRAHTQTHTHTHTITHVYRGNGGQCDKCPVICVCAFLIVVSRG